MLVSLQEILKDAQDKKYGVGLFNMLNLEMGRGIIDAAEEERSPIILALAEIHLPVLPFDYAIGIMNKIAKEATVPVALHFDHGTNYNKIMEALRGGFTSIMYDGSTLPYEENIANTRAISKIAHAMGAGVEAELGHVGGAEGGGDDGHEEQYTRVDQVNDFIRRADIDALAIAIGTAHGQYKVQPKLDLGRLQEIYAIAEKPLVLHGGSGLTDDDFRNCVKYGIRKVNICTEMCLAAHRAYTYAFNENTSFEIALQVAKQSVQEIVRDKMRLFGSNGKA